ncbi:MAG TPA: sigma-70 family RNA polymerase sigma factor [bacterium]|nr:sigma-70 family RNA polymerase sigma factor [bacterium]
MEQVREARTSASNDVLRTLLTSGRLANPAPATPDTRVSPEAALLEEMVQAHLDPLYRTALRLTGRPQDAEDLVQETFLRAWRSLHTYRAGTNPKAWLFRILHNAHIDRYRASTRTVPTVDEIEGQDPAFVVTETPETLVADTVMEAEVRDALMKLPEVFRACVVLADLEGFSYQEIAETLGIPRGTVMSRLFRGRRAMRKALAEYGRTHGLDRPN